MSARHAIQPANTRLTVRDSERGSSMLEFALSTVILFTLILGSIVVCMAFYTYEVMNQYARDASRYAIVHGNGCSYTTTTGGTTTTHDCSIGIGDNFNGTPPGSATAGTAPADTALATYLNNEIYPGINGNHLTVTTNYAKAPGATQCTITDCNGAGDQVTVTVTYPYLYAVPFVRSRSISMSGNSTMVISQ